MTEDERIFIATAVAPLVLPIYIAAVAFLDGSWPQFFIFVTTVVFAYGGTLLFGLPMVLLLRRLDLLTFIPVCIVGVTGGVIVGTILMVFVSNLMDSNVTGEELWQGAPVMAGFGLAIAFVWGLISGVHNNLANRH